MYERVQRSQKAEEKDIFSEAIKEATCRQFIQ
jgi:hypothetical protein